MLGDISLDYKTDAELQNYTQNVRPGGTATPPRQADPPRPADTSALPEGREK
jgi:hypothetical protein